MKLSIQSSWETERDIRTSLQHQKHHTRTGVDYREKAVSVNLKIILWLIAGFVLMFTFHGYHENLDGYQQTLICGRKVNISPHIWVSLCQNLVINTFFCPEACWPLLSTLRPPPLVLFWPWQWCNNTNNDSLCCQNRKTDAQITGDLVALCI